MDILSSTFTLDARFISNYAGKQPKFGPIGLTTFKRTYSRSICNLPERYQKLAKQYKLGAAEEYWLTLVRVIEGTYRIQEAHCKALHLPWSPRKAQSSAQEMYRLMWEFKLLPPGRGLWMMGTDYIAERGNAALCSCAFVTTSDIKSNFSDPFCFLMDMSMVGVGVGSDTRGAGTLTLKQPRISEDIHVVEDSREGWVDITRRYLDAYVGKDTIPKQVDFSRVRPEGVPLKGFGGVASGPAPLASLLTDIQATLNPLIGETITSTAIVDLHNLIARCVVAGNIRRSASIMFGQPDDQDFLELKDKELYPEQCNHHRWCSNNSVLASIGMDYPKCAERTIKFGEPGYLWLENSQTYSRMIDPPDYKDEKALGSNPCGEITLESAELCNLVECFPSLHTSYEEFERTLKYAYLYSKTVTLLHTHDPRVNAVMLRNRRLGVSMTGLAQALKRHGRSTMRVWSDEGYKYLRRLDKIYSSWLCIPESIKLSTVKPSGTTSLLPGVTPGIHFPHAPYYNRVIRFSTDSPILPRLRKAGYKCEEIDSAKEPNTTAVYFPIEEKHFDRSKVDVSMWEQLENAAMFQAYWADNQVSCTISFSPEEATQIPYALEIFETRLKGISFLPLMDHGYEHAPYQSITQEEYIDISSKIKKLDLSQAENEVIERYCSGDTCELQEK